MTGANGQLTFTEPRVGELLSGPWRSLELAEQSAWAFSSRGIEVVVVPLGKKSWVVHEVVA